MITLHPSNVKIAGPQVDGGWKVTFMTGAYDAESIAQLVQQPQEQNLTVNVMEEKDYKEQV